MKSVAVADSKIHVRSILSNFSIFWYSKNFVSIIIWNCSFISYFWNILWIQIFFFVLYPCCISDFRIRIAWPLTNLYIFSIFQYQILSWEATQFNNIPPIEILSCTILFKQKRSNKTQEKLISIFIHFLIQVKNYCKSISIFFTKNYYYFLGNVQPWKKSVHIAGSIHPITCWKRGNEPISPPIDYRYDICLFWIMHPTA